MQAEQDGSSPLVHLRLGDDRRGERASAEGAAQGATTGFDALDPSAQIRLFGKLKLTKCAPVTGLPETGFFMRAQAG
jgi:hypothetical protein